MGAQMIGQPLRQEPVSPRQDHRCAVDGHREQIVETIARLGVISRRGLWGILGFVAVSCLALQLRGVDLFAGFSDHVLRILGSAPPLILIHLVLAVSTCSTVVVLLGRIQNGETPARSRRDVCAGVAFRSAFYLFYAMAGALEGYFLVAFAAGIVVLALEHFVTWSSAARIIAEEKERLLRLGAVHLPKQ